MKPKETLEKFSSQLSYEEGLGVNLADYEGVVFCGMGGSAIVGDIAKSWLEHRGFNKPILSYRGYGLPNFVNGNYLLLCISYSGNTEETVSNFMSAVERGIKPICVSSGGKLREFAHENRARHIELPEGFAPRFALGFMLSKILCILGIDREEIEDAREHIQENAQLFKEKARYLADKFYGRIPLIYATPMTEAVSTRWKAEINENSKSPCYRAIIPEMHHNEVVGLSNPLMRNKFSFLLMNDPKDVERVRLRVEITLQLLKDYGVNPTLLSWEGNSYLSRTLALIYTGDWTSLYLAELYGYDPLPVKAIDNIKSALDRL
jgi:glucose/mannose-6-phosphate isomerase